MSEQPHLADLDPENVRLRAARVGPHVALRNVRLLNVQAQLHVDPPPGGELQAETEVQTGHALEDSHLRLRIGYFTRAKVRVGDAEPTEAWSVVSEWILDYQITDGAALDDDDCGSFGLVSGTFTIHPYAREMVHRMSGQMGYPALVLETLQSPLDSTAPAQ